MPVTWMDLFILPPTAEEAGITEELPEWQQRQLGRDDRWFCLHYLSINHDFIMEFLEKFNEIFPGRRCRVAPLCFDDGISLNMQLPEHEVRDDFGIRAVSLVGDRWWINNAWRVKGQVILDIDYAFIEAYPRQTSPTKLEI